MLQELDSKDALTIGFQLDLPVVDTTESTKQAIIKIITELEKQGHKVTPKHLSDEPTVTQTCLLSIYLCLRDMPLKAVYHYNCIPIIQECSYGHLKN